MWPGLWDRDKRMTQGPLSGTLRYVSGENEKVKRRLGAGELEVVWEWVPSLKREQ